MQLHYVEMAGTEKMFSKLCNEKKARDKKSKNR